MWLWKEPVAQRLVPVILAVLGNIGLLAAALGLEWGDGAALQLGGDLLRRRGDQVEGHTGAEEALGTGEADELLELQGGGREWPNSQTR